MLRLAVGRVGREARQLAERQVDLDHPAPRTPAGDVRREVRREVLGTDMVEKGCLRVQAGHDEAAPAARRRSPARHPRRGRPSTSSLVDSRIASHLGSERLSRAPDGCRHPAHPAFGIAPAAQLTVSDITDRVMRHDVRRTWLVRPRPGADDPVDGHGALHLWRLEPVVEQVRDAHRHQPGELGHGTAVQSTMTPGEPGQGDQLRGVVRADRRRHREQHRRQDVGETSQPVVPLAPGPGVMLRPAGDLVVRPGGVVVVDGQRPALREGLVVRTHRVHPVAVPLEREVAQDRCAASGS